MVDEGAKESKSDVLADEALDFWSPRSPRPLSREDGREMVTNIVGFFDLLDRWDRKDREKS